MISEKKMIKVFNRCINHLKGNGFDPELNRDYIEKQLKDNKQKLIYKIESPKDLNEKEMQRYEKR